ncbi:uncharacterized protein LOC124267904 [Haliotis rubra]|uniref:uncharacterized protein LOC124267904 n=1 Tax=Haliotis rubra TaxID=36100 RepID=UPI001EE5808B|nr:uncharacterized protein LOC124267904 [Haliotis rubra]
MSGKRAPSCHLVFDDHRKGDILMHDVHVPGHGVTMYTYYCCMQWNTCLNGGGYCGIQEHPNGQCYIFSIWDPMTTKEAITHVYKHPGTKVENFGGEGTGLKSMNFDIGWKADQWYTLVTRRWDYKGHSYFGFWVRNHSADKWEHVVTMDFPVPDIWFQTNTKSFIEDWSGNGEKYRRVHFQNGYKRRDDKSWHPFANAKFHVHQEKACEMYNDNYDGDVTATASSCSRDAERLRVRSWCEVVMSAATRWRRLSPVTFPFPLQHQHQPTRSRGLCPNQLRHSLPTPSLLTAQKLPVMLTPRLGHVTSQFLERKLRSSLRTFWAGRHPRRFP